MYRDVQEPMMDAALGNQNPFASLVGQGKSMIAVKIVWLKMLKNVCARQRFEVCSFVQCITSACGKKVYHLSYLLLSNQYIT